MRIHNLVPVVAVSSLLALSGPVSAVDAERGALLYENHCQVCHESTVHVREDRRVGNRPELLAMITRWATHLELDWSAEERLDVLEFLDRRYYGLGASSN